ncbi:MAG: spermidine synthase, partial [Deltaproteobacteria bacterium RIFOXYA12_FULL_61_11]
DRNRSGLTFRVGQVLYSGHSDFQRIEVFDTPAFGKVLVMYGSVMLTEKDEFVYHEMLAHPALHVHPAPKKVLIVGGGDGGTLREVVKHDRVERATLVEIDREVCRICKQYFPSVACAIDSPKTRLVFQDGAVYMAETNERYDLVLADVSDPVGPAEVVFQKPFHLNVFDRLNDDGIFVAQTQSPYYHHDTIRKLYRNLRQVFPIVRMYLAHIPTYPGAIWSFAFCSKQHDPLEVLQPSSIEGLRYYNTELHRGSFALPTYVAELIEA